MMNYYNTTIKKQNRRDSFKTKGFKEKISFNRLLNQQAFDNLIKVISKLNDFNNKFSPKV